MSPSLRRMSSRAGRAATERRDAYRDHPAAVPLVRTLATVRSRDANPTTAPPPNRMDAASAHRLDEIASPARTVAPVLLSGSLAVRDYVRRSTYARIAP